MPRTETEIIANMTNIGDSGQDSFVADWTEYAKNLLHERGVSQKYIDSSAAAYILAKIVTDIVEDGDLSKITLEMIASLRVNHPLDEDASEEA